MRNALNVTFNLDRLNCYDEADGWGSAEPYMWTVFFKIDGDTVHLNNSLMLEGTATIFPTPGSHGNLGDTDVDAGDTVPIPNAIGNMQMILTPIPVPDFVKQAGTDDVAGIAGCVLVLMEEDNITDDGAEAGHQALNTAVQNALDSIIPTLGASNASVSDEQISALFDQIESKVKDAIKNQQNIFENAWSWLNPDDTIGTVVWKFSGDTLLANPTIPLQQRWPNDQDRSNNNGDWEIFGEVTTIEIPQCPADIVKDIFDTIFGGGASKDSTDALYKFRNFEMIKYKGLSNWWSLAKHNGTYLKMALQDKEAAHAAMMLFKDVPEILKNRNAPLDNHHFNNALKVLEQILKYAEKNRKARKDIKRSLDAVQMLRGKTPHQIFELLSTIRPARYPSLNMQGDNYRLKINKSEK